MTDTKLEAMARVLDGGLEAIEDHVQGIVAVTRTVGAGPDVSSHTREIRVILRELMQVASQLRAAARPSSSDV